METEIKAAFPEARIRLVEGRGGVFDITINGHRIYSKKREGFSKFPTSALVHKRIVAYLSN